MSTCGCGTYCEDLGPQDGCRYFDCSREIWLDCDQCGGEGAFEKYESVSRWSIDPPSAVVVPCDVCNGAGGFICEAEGDR